MVLAYPRGDCSDQGESIWGYLVSFVANLTNAITGPNRNRTTK
jgi:hypothetical protein